MHIQSSVCRGQISNSSGFSNIVYSHAKNFGGIWVTSASRVCFMFLYPTLSSLREVYYVASDSLGLQKALLCQVQHPPPSGLDLLQVVISCMIIIPWGSCSISTLVFFSYPALYGKYMHSSAQKTCNEFTLSFPALPRSQWGARVLADENL